jgi:hypothetical protein
MPENFQDGNVEKEAVGNQGFSRRYQAGIQPTVEGLLLLSLCSVPDRADGNALALYAVLNDVRRTSDD